MRLLRPWQLTARTLTLLAQCAEGRSQHGYSGVMQSHAANLAWQQLCRQCAVQVTPAQGSAEGLQCPLQGVHYG